MMDAATSHPAPAGHGASMGCARGVTLVVGVDDAFLQSVCPVLQQNGFPTLTAHNPTAAEYLVSHRSDIRVMIIDAKVLGFVSLDRPGSILPMAQTLPMLVANAAVLDAARIATVKAYTARILPGEPDVRDLLSIEMPASQ
jgi:hypothetical protein